MLAVAAAARRAGRRRSLSAACVAYCFVTVPVLQDVLLKTRLYLTTAQVALACRCPGQGERWRGREEEGWERKTWERAKSDSEARMKRSLVGVKKRK